MKTLDILILLLLVIGVAGCEQRRLDIYLFGPAKSCFPMMERSKCDKLIVYDKVEMTLSADRQEVVYVQKGLRLDESNTIFRRLENCKVVDRDTFSCGGLVRTNRQFVDSKVFGDLVVSESYWTFAYSHYLERYVTRGRVQFFHDNDSWLPLAVGVFILLALTGLVSER